MSQDTKFRRAYKSTKPCEKVGKREETQRTVGVLFFGPQEQEEPRIEWEFVDVKDSVNARLLPQARGLLYHNGKTTLK